MDDSIKALEDISNLPRMLDRFGEKNSYNDIFINIFQTLCDFVSIQIGVVRVKGHQYCTSDVECFGYNDLRVGDATFVLQQVLNYMVENTECRICINRYKKV